MRKITIIEHISLGRRDSGPRQPFQQPISLRTRSGLATATSGESDSLTVAARQIRQHVGDVLGDGRLLNTISYQDLRLC